MQKVEEIIEKWKDFESRCSAKRGTQIDRIKEDRRFLSGDQFEKEDNKLIAKSRPRRVINVLANSVNSTANGYATYPYKWYSDDQETDEACNSFLRFGSNARAAYDVLYSNVAFGLGYFALGSESVNDGSGNMVDVPALYCVDRIENVYFDPDSIEMDGHDAMEAAIVEFRSKNWVEAKYGPEFAPMKGVKPVVNVSGNSDPDQMVLVTYYRVEQGKCSVYHLLNNQFYMDPEVINIARVPVFPVYGERTWVNDDIVWQGIVRKGAQVQKIINYAFTQLGERLAIAPKPTWLTRPEAIENYTEGYRNFNNNLNPLLLWNPESPDGKVQYQEPKRIDNQVQFNDLTGIISANLELLSTITGVDAKGIMDGTPQVTATQVISEEHQHLTTIQHFYANLRDTFKAVGETVMDIMGYHGHIEVIQGPAESTELQVARSELVQLAGLVPEQHKMKVVNGILLTHKDNGILRDVFGALNGTPEPTAMEQEAMDTVEQMKQALDQKNQQIQDLTEQIKRLEQYSDNNDKSIAADMVKMDVEHAYKQQDMILQAQLDAGKDAGKAEADAEKAQLGAQKAAIDLEKTRAKAAADIATTMAPAQPTIIPFGGNA